jgi:hypothetical protein
MSAICPKAADTSLRISCRGQATSCREQSQQGSPYSISRVRARLQRGGTSPTIFAVLRLILLGRCLDGQIGRFLPLRVRSTHFTVLTGFRLQEPFVQNGCPRLFSYYAVNGQVLILLVVLDRRFRGRAELAVLRQDRKASSFVQHELKMFNYRWAALRA